MLAALLLAAGACGDNEPAGPADQLDRETAMQIGLELFSEIVDFALGSLPWAVEESAAATGPVAAATVVQVERASPCASGMGTLYSFGTMTSDITPEGNGGVIFALTHRPIECRVATERGTITVDGAPSLNVRVDLTASTFAVTHMEVKFSGFFRWSSNRGSGTCRMDLEYAIEYGATQQVSLSGSICDHAI